MDKDMEDEREGIYPLSSSPHHLPLQRSNRYIHFTYQFLIKLIVTRGEEQPSQSTSTLESVNPVRTGDETSQSTSTAIK